MEKAIKKLKKKMEKLKFTGKMKKTNINIYQFYLLKLKKVIDASKYAIR